MFDKKLLLQHITNQNLNEQTTDLTTPTQEQIDEWHTLSAAGKRRIRSGKPGIDWDHAEANPPATPTTPTPTTPTPTPHTPTPPAAGERLELPDPDEVRARAIARLEDKIGNLDPQKITRTAKEVFTPILKKTIDTARTASEGLPQLAALKKEMQAYKPNIPASPRRNIGNAPKYKKRVNTKGY